MHILQSQSEGHPFCTVYKPYFQTEKNGGLEFQDPVILSSVFMLLLSKAMNVLNVNRQ